MSNKIKILIPAKGKSIRSPGKNLLLLPFTLDYVKQFKSLYDIYVMTDCPLITRMATDNDINILPELCIGNDFAVNFTASYKSAGWLDDDIVILLEPTKPFRQQWLLENCLQKYRITKRLITTGIDRAVTIVELDGEKSKRHVSKKVLDGSIIIAQCFEYAKIKTMTEFWDNKEVGVVWHDAPVGVDFDYTIDIETHLPTVSRLYKDIYFQPL